MRIFDPDFVKTELKQARLENLATAPSTPVLGQVYWDTVLATAMAWNGAEWVKLGGAGTWEELEGKPSEFTPEAHSHDFEQLAQHPADAPVGTVYFNTSSSWNGLWVRRKDDGVVFEGDWWLDTDWEHLGSPLYCFGEAYPYKPNLGTIVYDKVLGALLFYNGEWQRLDLVHSHTWIALSGRPSTYPPSAHQHTQAESHDSPDTDTGATALHHTLGTGENQAAAGNHDHAGVYAEDGHDHAALYAALGHDHDEDYAAAGHDHDAAYAGLVHGHRRTITFVFDGQGGVVSAGSKAQVYVYSAVLITGVVLIADQAGSAVVDLWVDNIDNYPPTVADSIIGPGGTKPTLSAAIKSADRTLTDWACSLGNDVVLVAKVDSCSTCTKLELTLDVITFE